MPVPRIDHVVVDVADRMDEAAHRYRALGFHLTDRAQHSIGSANHLAMFDTDYLELLAPGGGARVELAGFPVGLNGLVFAMHGAEALRENQSKRGIPVQPVQSFSRGVRLPDGQSGEARFNVVRLEPRTVFDGRVYFCEHLKPEMVWRPEWQAHPNGALDIARIAVSARDPDRVADYFDRIFDAGAAERAKTPNEPHVVRAGAVAVEIWSRDPFLQSLSHAVPDPAGREDYLALLGIRVRSLRAAEEALRAKDINHAKADGGRLLVSPAEAMNVTLEFAE